MPSCFIAGHRGMAGSAILRRLIKDTRYQAITANRRDLDLTNSSEVERWFQENKPEVIILAAARVGGILANDNHPADFLLENLKIQNNVIESGWKNGCKRMLFLGSSCIYPKFAEQPIREEALLTGPLEPTNEWYATAKITGIQLCRALRKQHGFDAISLMPTNLYGPGDNYHPTGSHVLPALIRRFQEAKEQGAPSVTCWGTGSPMREFLHVDDLADAALHCLEHWHPGPDDPNHINVGSGSDVTIKELAEQVAAAVGYEGEILWDTSKPDGTPRKLLDVSRLRNLGWTARIPLEEGLRSTVADFLARRASGEVRL